MKSTVFLVSLLLSASAAAGVYKWVDTDGRVHYSDKPPATKAELLDIETERTDPQRVAARVQASQPASTPADTVVADESERERLEREQKIQRDENCARARKALDSLLSATRVYEPLPGGGRRYLEQAELDQKMSGARRDVDQWCDNSS